MEITFSQRMRELRSRRKNTQEQLAGHLGITTQAVSKWERGEGFPDIAMLPSIASFYNVSIDYLLGVDRIARQQKLEEYEQKSKMLCSAENVTKRVALWTEAYREFPNEPQVLHNLSFALRAEGLEMHSEEIISLAKRLLKEANQSGQYFGAVNNLCRAYASMGDMEEAKRYAAMAGRYIGTENQLMIRILAGEEAAAFCQWNIETLVDLIATNAAVMLQKGDFTQTERIHISEQIIKLFALVYEDGCYGFYHSRISEWYMRLARYHAQTGDRQETIRCLQYAIEHGKAYDALGNGQYTALLVNRLTYRSGRNSEKAVQVRVREMADSCFAFIKEDPAYKALSQTGSTA